MKMQKPGASSQGYRLREWMFIASFNRSPQLVDGGLIPRPRKLSVLSPRMKMGIASVAMTMMWLNIDGSR